MLAFKTPLKTNNGTEFKNGYLALWTHIKKICQWHGSTLIIIPAGHFNNLSALIGQTSSVYGDTLLFIKDGICCTRSPFFGDEIIILLKEGDKGHVVLQIEKE